jgi:hypothetical protein
MHRSRTMKSAFHLFPVVLVLAACNRDETTNAPKAVEVKETPVIASESSAVPKAVVVSESELRPPVAAKPQEGKLIVKKPSAPPAPRKRLPQVVDKVGEALETARRETRQAAAFAEERAPEALDIAREKTGAGLRKAADATGNFLQRAGEKIEEKAGEGAEP